MLTVFKRKKLKVKIKQKNVCCRPEQKREYCSRWNQHDCRALTYSSSAKPRVSTARYWSRTWLYLMQYENASQYKSEKREKKRNSIIEYLRNSQRFTRCCWVSYSELSIAFSLPIFSSSYIPFLYFDLFVFVRNTDLSVWDSYHFMSET